MFTESSVGKCPLHITWRELVGPDTLVRHIDSQLDEIERVLPVSACHVTLTGDREPRASLRVTVSLEIHGGECITFSVHGTDVTRVIDEAFAQSYRAAMRAAG